MKILITGANGFIAKNLLIELKNRGYNEIFICDKGTNTEDIEKYVAECDTIIHLAGINRPENISEFNKGNVGFTEVLIQLMKKYEKKRKFIFSSSTQAQLDNPYGNSKRNAEKLLKDYAKAGYLELSIYRLPNVFGKWCRPNYNSVVATFCYNIAHNLEITIHDENAQITLVYIDDVVSSFIEQLETEKEVIDVYIDIKEKYTITVGMLANRIKSFKKSRETLDVPNLSDDFEKKLYSTYLSYLDKDDFSYSLKMNVDERGSFTEFIRSMGAGQVSINVVKPGIAKGNHWHHTKAEKFLVVKGKAQIAFRHMITGEIVEYTVSEEKLEVVDIPTGYTHNIKNIGTEDLITVMWANETFNPNKPDTFFEEV